MTPSPGLQGAKRDHEGHGDGFISFLPSKNVPFWGRPTSCSKIFCVSLTRPAAGPATVNYLSEVRAHCLDLQPPPQNLVLQPTPHNAPAIQISFAVGLTHSLVSPSNWAEVTSSIQLTSDDLTVPSPLDSYTQVHTQYTCRLTTNLSHAGTQPNSRLASIALTCL